MKSVYSMTRAFRAEKSFARRHLAEFTMVEAEIAFMERLEDLLQVVGKLMSGMTECLLDRCFDDAKTVIQHNDIDLEDATSAIEALRDTDRYTTMSYSDALTLLDRKADSFKFRPKYGRDLAKEHEKYLVEACGNRPVFVTHYPSSIKPFYMLRSQSQNHHIDSSSGDRDQPGSSCSSSSMAPKNREAEDDTCECFDLLVPRCLEIAGGSLRETSYDALVSRIGLDPATDDPKTSLQWYCDLRKYGHAPTAGFGLGFERFLQAALGIPVLKDSVTFPRYYKRCYM